MIPHHRPFIFIGPALTAVDLLFYYGDIWPGRARGAGRRVRVSRPSPNRCTKILEFFSRPAFTFSLSIKYTGTYQLKMIPWYDSFVNHDYIYIILVLLSVYYISALRNENCPCTPLAMFMEFTYRSILYY